MGTANKSNKQTLWVKRLRDAKEFSGTQKQYCARLGISYPSFRYWCKRLEVAPTNSVALSSPFSRVERQIEVSTKHPSGSGAQFIAEVLFQMSRMIES